MGSYVGFAAGASAVAATTAITTAISGENAMVDYGWRIPFLLAIPLGSWRSISGCGSPRTPSFEQTHAAEAEQETGSNDPMARQGLRGIVRHHWRALLIGIALVAATNTAGYALTSYMPTYLEKEVGISNLGAAVATVPVLLVMSAMLPLIGKLSDRIGRKPVYAIAAGSAIVLLVPAFLIMQIGELWAVMIALALAAVPVAFYVAISASALPALFPTASRFGAMAVAYNIAVSLFGGTTPLFSQALIEWTGNTLMPAFYIMFFAALGLVALFAMRETARRPLLGSVPAVETPARGGGGGGAPGRGPADRHLDDAARDPPRLSLGRVQRRRPVPNRPRITPLRIVFVDPRRAGRRGVPSKPSTSAATGPRCS